MRLEISQEVSSLRTAAQSALVGASDITTTKRSIKTTVLVEDGQVVVLGGLIDDTTRENMQKVPGLGDIPVLGRLFNFETTELAKRNLMIFIRPVIIRDPQYAEYLSNRKIHLHARPPARVAGARNLAAAECTRSSVAGRSGNSGLRMA